MSMNNEQIKARASLFSGLGLALIGTTCCALPIVLVALGLGSAVASMVAVMPWLTTLSQYKIVTFSLTAAVLLYNHWRLRRLSLCSLADKQRLRWQKTVLLLSTAILLVSVFAAYALLPLTLWLENQ